MKDTIYIHVLTEGDGYYYMVKSAYRYGIEDVTMQHVCRQAKSKS